MYCWTANRSRMVSCTPQMSLWGLLGIHIRHPGVLGGHGSKVEVRVEILEQVNIELIATIFSISMYF